MNDPQYLGAARQFAVRILREGPQDADERAAWAFEQAVVRPPTPHELDELLAAFHDFADTYYADLGAAEALIAIGELPPDPSLQPAELATWTMLANVIFNLDQFVTKE